MPFSANFRLFALPNASESPSLFGETRRTHGMTSRAPQTSRLARLSDRGSEGLRQSEKSIAQKSAKRSRIAQAESRARWFGTDLEGNEVRHVDLEHGFVHAEADELWRGRAHPHGGERQLIHVQV